jgi:hypothetical protein
MLWSLSVLALGVAGWLAFSYVFISFFEYQIHRHLMHRKRLPKWLYRVSPYVLKTFESHAVCHHGVWYKRFDYEPDPRGREHNLDIKLGETAVMLLCLAPVFALLLWLSPWGGAIVLAVSVLHNRLWNVLHRQMHIPQRAFFRNWPAFRFLARQHFMHHQQTTKNYNVVFPLFDFLLGSVARPSLGDIREMLRLGHLRARTALGRARVEQRQQKVVADRAQSARRQAA